MKHALVSLLLCLCLQPGIRAASSATDTTQTRSQIAANLIKSGTDAEFEKFAEEWEKDSPDDADLYVARANFYVTKAGSGRVEIRGNPKRGQYKVSADRQDDSLQYKLTDPKTGKVVGSIGTSGPQTESDAYKKAIDVLETAHKKFPDRLDISFGLAHCFEEAVDFDNEFRVLKDTGEHAAGNLQNLRWMENKDLPGKPEEFIPVSLHEYANHWMQRREKGNDDRFLKIAELSNRLFPAHPYSWNDIGGYYGLRGDYAKALTFYKKAFELDPKDALIAHNIAYSLERLGQIDEARKYYKQAAEMSDDPRYGEDLKKFEATTGKRRKVK